MARTITPAACRTSAPVRARKLLPAPAEEERLGTGVADVPGVGPGPEVGVGLGATAGSPSVRRSVTSKLAETGPSCDRLPEVVSQVFDS